MLFRVQVQNSWHLILCLLNCCLFTVAYAHLPFSCSCLGVFVPVGGKKLLTFMDDLNMPAKDTFGSQPPLELIRQWMDYGFWYDRLKQVTKTIKVHCFLLFFFSQDVCYRDFWQVWLRKRSHEK